MGHAEILTEMKIDLSINGNDAVLKTTFIVLRYKNWNLTLKGVP